MRHLFTFLMILSVTNIIAQSQNGKLYYFKNPKDSLIGVKDSKGAIIIPAIGYDILETDLTQPILDSLIHIYDFNRDKGDTGTAQSFGSVYDRRGTLLYRPLLFDSGPDYFVEGLARCVANGKAGFVNEQGEIVIKPQWDWISSFNYGYAYGCNNCYWNRNKDQEHPPMAFKENADTVYINREGKVVPLMDAPKTAKDLPIDGGFLPYPFKYTPEEQKIIDEINNLEVLSKIRNANYSSKFEDKNAKIQFEIFERPTIASPYYKIQGYSSGDFRIEERFLFYRTKSGEMYAINWLTKEKMPYKKWLKEELESCNNYFKEHPGGPNNFDTDFYLKNL